jgi:hypothetical protein
LNIELAAESCF